MNLLKNNIVHRLFRKFKDVIIVNGKIRILWGLPSLCSRSLIWVKGGEQKRRDRGLIFDEVNCWKLIMYNKHFATLTIQAYWIFYSTPKTIIFAAQVQPDHLKKKVCYIFFCFSQKFSSHFCLRISYLKSFSHYLHFSTPLLWNFNCKSSGNQ